MRVDRFVDVWSGWLHRLSGWRTGATITMLPAVLALGTPSALPAQFSGAARKLSIAPRVGVSLPAGQFSDYADAGPTAGLRIGYEIWSGGSLIFDAEMDNLRGTTLYPGLPTTQRTPDIQLRHFVGGLEVHADRDETRPWLVLGTIGAGALMFDSDPYVTPEGEGEFEYTGLTAEGGVEIGYALSSRLALVADGKVCWTFIDEARTEDLAAIGPAILDPFDSAFTIPVTLAIRTRI